MRFKTRSVHAGQSPDPAYGAVMPPIYQTSTFAYTDPEQAPPFDYTRSGNPTRHALETCLAALENGTRAFAFASGMAAEAALVGILAQGDHIILSDECYGGTYRYMMGVAQRNGIEITMADLSRPESLPALLRPNTKMLWIETPSNPLMKVVDLAALAAIAEQHGLIAVADNTFLSPYFQNPLDFGIHAVLHSTTKYINGHSDVVGGAVIVKDDTLANRIYFMQNAQGGVPGPWDCFLVMRGLKTLALRMQAHDANALALANRLAAHPKVEQVLHTGLPAHPQHQLACRQARGHGGTFSFFLRGGLKETYAFLRSLKLTSQAVSLGGVESLVAHPWTMTHAAIPEADRRAMGIRENLIRVSVGIEDIEDILEDFESALDRV